MSRAVFHLKAYMKEFQFELKMERPLFIRQHMAPNIPYRIFGKICRPEQMQYYDAPKGLFSYAKENHGNGFLLGKLSVILYQVAVETIKYLKH